MGATIFTRQHIEVVPLPDGNDGFVLWEERYENNVYPHTPHWSCVSIGRRPDALRSIFSHAAGCEGGMFRPRTGECRPENYICRWQRAAHMATLCSTTSVRIDRSMKPFLWSEEDERKFDNRMTEADPIDATRRDDWNRGKTIEFELPQEFDTLVAIVNAKQIPAWQAFKFEPDLRGQPFDARTALFPALTRKSAPEPFAKVLRITQASDNLFEEVEPGVLVHRGAPYTLVSRFVKEAAEVEIHLPGCFYGRIVAFRKHVLGATLLDETTMLMPFVPDGTLSYPASKTQELVQLYPRGLCMSAIAAQFPGTWAPEMFAAANAAGYRIVA